MLNAKILWVDDEIEHLKPHIKFLKEKGLQVEPISNGPDALERLKEESFDIVFLDENMPGMSGLDVLAELKQTMPKLPVIMITKSEEEHIMEGAIGSKIADYLIKPVKPIQILSACKKILEGKTLVNQKVNQEYQQDFRHLAMQVMDAESHEDWQDIHKKLVYWEGEIEKNADKSMGEVLNMQQQEANSNFSRFVSRNYMDWLHTKNKADRPTLSPDLMRERVFPHIEEGKYDSVFFILVDCLRYDQWKVFETIISDYYHVEHESSYYSILPTATQYSRNAIFSGMHPLEISKRYPKYWLNDDEEGGKNLHEADFLGELVTRAKLNVKYSYHKVITNEEGKLVNDNVNNLMKNPFNAIVYNFIDLLSHSRTESNIIRELAPNEAAYRSISRSWLEFSPLLQTLKKLAEKNVKVIITTDHGTVRVKKPVRIVGDRTTTTNLRYKQGKSLSYEEDNRTVFTIRKPEDAFLPKAHVSSTYVFAMDDCFFAYPNNYNYYVNYYKDTFQHGGISMNEMLIPFIELRPKGR
ncbi:MAG: response regulator [Bacteroidia bacterium]